MSQLGMGPASMTMRKSNRATIWLTSALRRMLIPLRFIRTSQAGRYEEADERWILHRSGKSHRIAQNLEWLGIPSLN